MVDRLAYAAIIVCALGVSSPVTAQEVKTALTEQMRSLQDELAKAVSAREASERATADLRNKLTAAAQAARDGAVALELERARTEVAEEKLRALQAKIDQREAATTELAKMRVRQAQTAKPAPRILEGSDEPAAIKEYRKQREIQRRYESPTP
jgi:cellobiose-specific phosphotransferase system component IIB